MGLFTTASALILSLTLVTGAHADSMEVSKQGSRDGTIGAADYFVGTVYVEPLFGAREPFDSYGASVTFLPGARSNWHSHPGGQVLLVTQGTGWVQQQGGERIVMQAGDVIWTPPGVTHWHGATDRTAVTHLAIQQTRDGAVVTWKEPVTEPQYRGATQ